MYYPKSQIKTNLYTNGKELTLSTDGTFYKGPYYELSTGKKYTGKTPEDGINIELSPITSNPILSITPEDNQIYLTQNPISKTLPTRSIPQFN